MEIRRWELTDAEAWRAALARVRGGREPFRQPGYLALEAGPEGTAACLCVEEGPDLLLHAFVLRPVPRFASLAEESLCDIQSPYGYDGPAAAGDGARLAPALREAMVAYAAEKHAVAEFVRFHPLEENHELLRNAMELIDACEAVSLPLSSCPETQLAGYEGRCRNMVRRALRQGVRIRYGTGEEDWERFQILYRATMERHEANPMYFYPDSYFEGLRRLFGEQAILLLAEADGAIASAGLFLQGEETWYYHLAGNDASLPVRGANNLLLHEAACRAAERGMHELFLGGGAGSSADDPLLRFKQSFGAKACRFWIGGAVLDRARYDALCAAWAAEHPDRAARYGDFLLKYRR